MLPVDHAAMVPKDEHGRVMVQCIEESVHVPIDPRNSVHRHLMISSEIVLGVVNTNNMPDDELGASLVSDHVLHDGEAEFISLVNDENALSVCMDLLVKHSLEFVPINVVSIDRYRAPALVFQSVKNSILDHRVLHHIGLKLQEARLLHASVTLLHLEDGPRSAEVIIYHETEVIRIPLPLLLKGVNLRPVVAQLIVKALNVIDPDPVNRCNQHPPVRGSKLKLGPLLLN